MKLIASAVALTLLSSVAIAQTTTTPPAATTPSATSPNASSPPGTTPAAAFTVTNYYKQDIYDGSDNKIGSVDDVLIDKNGQVTALMISVGGFLGIGDKVVKTNFQDVKMTKKNDKWYLTMNATKDSLKSAPGYKYDRTATTWVPDTGNTAGSTGTN